MCKYCENEGLKLFRASLAAKAVGLFATIAKDDSPDGIEAVVTRVVGEFKDLTKNTRAPFVPCEDFEEELVQGIRRAWPELTMEQKLEAAMASGNLVGAIMRIGMGG